MATLVFPDEKTLDVTETFVKYSSLISNLIEDTDADDVYLTETTYDAVKKVIQMVNDYQPHEKLCYDCEDDRLTAHEEFAKKLGAFPDTDLFEMVIASDYLGMTAQYIDVLCRAIASHIKDLTPEEIRKKYDIPYDFTPEDEARIKAEEEWIKKYGCK